MEWMEGLGRVGGMNGIMVLGEWERLGGRWGRYRLTGRDMF